MITKRSDKNRFFYIECGDWTGVTIASTHREACDKLFLQAKDIFGKELKLTKVSVVMDCGKTLDREKDDIEAFLSESVIEGIE